MGKLGFKTGFSSLKKIPICLRCKFLHAWLFKCSHTLGSMQSCLKQRSVINLFKSHSLRWLCANKGDNECLGMNSVVFFLATNYVEVQVEHFLDLL